MCRVTRVIHKECGHVNDHVEMDCNRPKLKLKDARCDAWDQQHCAITYVRLLKSSEGYECMKCNNELSDDEISERS